MINLAGFNSKILALTLWLGLLGEAVWASPSGSPDVPVPQDSMAQRMQACTVCHGKEGRATSEGYFPRIAGKPAEYLYRQLVHFREGGRSYAAMTGLLEFLSDDYLREMAAYFSGLDLPYPPPQIATASAEVLAQGRTLVLRGDATRGLPACVHCHGQALTGVMPAVPGLLGLPRDYLTGQLGAWKNGKRRGTAPDCMRQIATRLRGDEVSAVAQWLASQPLPAHATPAPAKSIPADCGLTLK